MHRSVLGMVKALWLGGLAAGFAASAWPQSIYTCIDKNGRRLTSDRPIAECRDRVQHELNPSGTIKREIGPTLTAEERAALEEQERRAAEERAKAAEERRRMRALLARYPNQATHDNERRAVLAQIDSLIRVAEQRIADLAAQRAKLDTEAEFYQRDPSRYPPALRRQYDENDKQVDTQRRFIERQQDEKKRTNERFDAELAQLRQLWAMQSPVRPSSPPARN